MNGKKAILGKYGVKVPEVLLPANREHMDRWAVVACDQYTSQRDYWEKVETYTANTPSTLNLVFPECYLEDPEPEKRISSINNSMREYIAAQVFEEPFEGFILVKRETPVSRPRWGLVAALDLEQYDFSPDSKSLIRATEGTILERIPPRVRIRENAELELPHIMVLIDDPGRSLIEPLAEACDDLEKVYDFELMMNSGHLTGYKVDSAEQTGDVAEALDKLGSKETLQQKYGDGNAFLFAMGDGNHSLATAKTIWENYKKNNTGDKKLMEHPSRWALVEIVNIFSEGITFEAIHRVVFGCNPEVFLSEAEKTGKFRVKEMKSIEEVISYIDSGPELQTCGFCTKELCGIIEALDADSLITAGTFQDLIDSYMSSGHCDGLDYIHGIDVTLKLGRQTGNIGIFLPAIKKESFFQTIISEGAFPRKTFSMGESFEKRFYVEARKIK